MTSAITLCGSIRAGSINQKLVDLMNRKLAERGADLEALSLRDYPMPIYNRDIELEGAPEAAVALAEKFARADIIFIGSPEYNGSVTPLIKNTIDWVSRQGALRPYARAVFGLGGVTGGKLATVQALSHLQASLSKLNALVATPLLGIGEAETAFDAQGNLTAEPLEKRVDLLADRLIELGARPR